MNLVGQIIITLIFITILFFVFIKIYKKHEPTILTDKERKEQENQIYAALKEIVDNEELNISDEMDKK